MRFVDSRCSHCGATLRVAQDATHVSCQYCHAELIVLHDGAAVTTRLLGEMKQDLGQKLDVLRVQNELERLDREWTLQRESFMVSGQHGARSIPTGAGSLFGGLILAAAGVAWMFFTSSQGAPGFVPLFGVVFIGGGLWTALVGMSKASAHDTAETTYRSRRSALLRDLERVQRSG